MSENEGSKLKVMSINDKSLYARYGKLDLIPELDKVNEQLGEIGKDIYEKINMTGNTVLSVPAMPALNHNVTLDEDEFKTKVLAIIAEYNRIVDTIVGFNCFVNYVPVKDIYDEDMLSSAFRQAVEARENSLVELQNQLQALMDTWAELKSHIVVDTPSFPLPTLITLMPDIQ